MAVYITPASQVMNKVKGEEFVRDYVREILSVIDDDIKQTIDGGLKNNYSITEVPTMFDVPGMSSARAQMYIYYLTMKKLKKKGYSMKIQFVKRENIRKVYMHVCWFSPKDVEIEKYMNSYVKKHSLKDEQTELTEAIPIRRRRRIPEPKDVKENKEVKSGLTKPAPKINLEKINSRIN